MLADWYFCCCVKATPRTSTTYLSILYALADPSADLDLVIAAIGELRRCDIWMRAHALPAVLALLNRSKVQEINRSYLSSYFEELLEALPEDVARSFGALQSAILSDGLLTIEEFETCISILDDNPSRAPSDIPYLDLRDFLPETIILATFAARLDRDRGRYGSMFSVGDDSGSQSMSRLVARALNGLYGRMAFLLAIEISGGIGNNGNRAQLVQRLSSARECGLEPDMLLSYAQLRFIPFGLPSLLAAPGLVSKILEETIVLTALREGMRGRLSIESRVLAESNEAVREA